jgi:hypothetical protein
MNIAETLCEFKAAKINFEVKTENDTLLPNYKGSTFRGVFGHIFKDVMCFTFDSVCETCNFQAVCMFKKIFDSPPSSNSTRLKNYSSLPHPYIIEAPLESKNFYKTNETIKFSLVLIGQAVSLFPYFAYSFGLAGKKGIGKMRNGKFILCNIINDKNKQKLYNPNKEELISLTEYYTINDFISKKTDNESKLTVCLDFITPTKIIFNEKIVQRLEFHIFIRNILRRISNLNFFHCITQAPANNENNYCNNNNKNVKNNNDINFNYFIEKAYNVKGKNNLMWRSVDRYSNRQKSHMKISGFIGEVLFEDVPLEFLWIIKLGELIHVGKNTTFGNGKYIIKSII